MNLKTMSPITLLAILAVVLLGTVGAIYAYNSIFSKTYTWGVTNPSYGLYTDESCTIPLNSTTINFGSLSVGETRTITVYAKNTGDTPITIEASATVTGATPLWLTLTTATDLPIGNSAMFSLQLTIESAGSCVLSFEMV